MMSIKDLVFTGGHRVELQYVQDGTLYYNLLNMANSVLLSFTVPQEDQLGATFQIADTPKVFMRWIRKAVELHAETQAQVAAYKAAWEKEIDGEVVE